MRSLSPREREVLALLGGTAAWEHSGRQLQTGMVRTLSSTADVYQRPYEDLDIDPAVMQAYLDWEHGLVAQLERDQTHHFFVL